VIACVIAIDTAVISHYVFLNKLYNVDETEVQAVFIVICVIQSYSNLVKVDQIS